jgi:hypothetical protein|tara:strand:+ start:443 stop:829 length:387 start_codon:yes stop_codon:yes gene_type:complete
MMTYFFDDFLIGGWAYAKRSGVSDDRACSLAVAQLELFVMITLTPWLVLLLKYLRFDNSNIIYFIIGFAIMLGITFEIYISKKDLFRDIDVQTENVSKKIRKCTYFFIFLFFYLPLSTYISWPIIRQL